MTQITTETEAIARSVKNNAIVTIDGDDATHTALLCECEDSAQNGDVTEYWGTTESGSEWRVHVRTA